MKEFVLTIAIAVLVLLGVYWAVAGEREHAPTWMGHDGGLRYNRLVPSTHGALADCAVCHQLAADEPPRSAPSLLGIIGASAGRAEWFGYSPALAALNETWDRERLDGYLANPSLYLPGTTKTLPPISDDQRRREILDALERLK